MLFKFESSIFITMSVSVCFDINQRIKSGIEFFNLKKITKVDHFLVLQMIIKPNKYSNDYHFSYTRGT